MTMPEAIHDHTISPEPTGDRGRTAAHYPWTTRRGLPAIALLLGAAAAIPVLAAGAEADAELIRLCQQFHQQHAEMEAIPNDDWKMLGNAAMEARDNTIRLIEGLRAVTERGRQMKASVAVVLLVEYGDGPELALAALRDVAGRA
jgi:hypothetical protein